MERPEVEEIIQFMRIIIAPMLYDSGWTMHSTYVNKKLDVLEAYIRELEVRAVPAQENV